MYQQLKKHFDGMHNLCFAKPSSKTNNDHILLAHTFYLTFIWLWNLDASFWKVCAAIMNSKINDLCDITTGFFIISEIFQCGFLKLSKKC